MWPFRKRRRSLESYILELLLTFMSGRIKTMALNVQKLTDAVAASIAKTEALIASNAALTARVTDLQNQLASITVDPAADQAAVDAQADALAAETAKVS